MRILIQNLLKNFDKEKIDFCENKKLRQNQIHIQNIEFLDQESKHQKVKLVGHKWVFVRKSNLNHEVTLCKNNVLYRRNFEEENILRIFILKDRSC